MVKKDKEVREESINYNVPAGYEEESGDIVGFWAPELSPTIHFVPIDARTFDNSADSKKPSILITGHLIDAIPLVKEDVQVNGKKGDVIGVWYKPGMKAVRNLAGVPVFMHENGEKDVGKASPMSLFKLFYDKKLQPSPLMLSGDYRKDSMSASLPFPHKAELVPAGQQPYQGQF